MIVALRRLASLTHQRQLLEYIAVDTDSELISTRYATPSRAASTEPEQHSGDGNGDVGGDAKHEEESGAVGSKCIAAFTVFANVPTKGAIQRVPCESKLLFGGHEWRATENEADKRAITVEVCTRLLGSHGEEEGTAGFAVPGWVIIFIIGVVLLLGGVAAPWPCDDRMNGAAVGASDTASTSSSSSSSSPPSAANIRRQRGGYKPIANSADEIISPTTPPAPALGAGRGRADDDTDFDRLARRSSSVTASAGAV